MARPRKWSDDAERRQAQTDARKAKRARHEVEFVCIDGEGVGRGRDHKYVLLGAGDRTIDNGDGLKFTEIMNFLSETYYAHPGAAFTGFYLGYDFTQLFRLLPRERAWYLFTEKGIAKRQRRKMPQLGPFPVEYEGFEFDLLGMKRLKVRQTGTKGWMYICDAGSFFQASLMSVINPKRWEIPVVSEDEYAILEEGKSRRDKARLDDDMRRYNILENRVLARLMGRLNEGFNQAGIHLKKSQWFGPGQAAQAWLTQIKAPTGESIRTQASVYGQDSIHGSGRHRNVPGGSEGPGTPLLDAARYSYYGGWFEIFAHGHIPGQSWEYDINSAYPYIISTLPCLTHGQWSHDNDFHREPGPGRPLQLVSAVLQGTNARIGSMLHRCEDHTIRRPLTTAGWYWAHELRAAIRTGLVHTYRVRETWTYLACDCKPPLRGIVGLYEERLRVGKNTPAGNAYKLMYNSAYGKFAQSIGNPKYGNPFYASLITSGCRTMILDAIATHPKGTHGVVMVATDGIYFVCRHPGLDIGSGLGQWEEKCHDGLTLFKPGVYWTDATRAKIANGQDPSFKARGISAKDFAGQLSAVDNHFSRWPDEYPHERDPDGPTREGWYPKVEFTAGFSMVTCQQALQRGKWHLAGTLGHSPIPDGCQGCSGAHLIQDADPIGKRHSGYLGNDGIYWSKPFKDGGPSLESTPYDKRFGQPDPDEFGITDDGTVKDQWAQMIR